MAYIQSPPFLHSLTPNHADDEPWTSTSGKQNQKLRRSSSSLSRLVHFVRNPIESVGEAVENWYDGTTKEERARRQCLADRKQIIYLKMRMVSLLLIIIRAMATNADRARLGYESC